MSRQRPFMLYLDVCIRAVGGAYLNCKKAKVKNIYVIQKLLSERTQDIRVNAFGVRKC